mmetsp:Transcript_137128/g.341827  ORF Transcript_137128/g.341827 Transcript_137128/m.341827 type:complete len:323 (-) Transcript_137128:141-1109(-)
MPRAMALAPLAVKRQPRKHKVKRSKDGGSDAARTSAPSLPTSWPQRSKRRSRNSTGKAPASNRRPSKPRASSTKLSLSARSCGKCRNLSARACGNRCGAIAAAGTAAAAAAAARAVPVDRGKVEDVTLNAPRPWPRFRPRLPRRCKPRSSSIRPPGSAAASAAAPTSVHSSSKCSFRRLAGMAAARVSAPAVSSAEPLPLLPPPTMPAGAAKEEPSHTKERPWKRSRNSRREPGNRDATILALRRQKWFTSRWSRRRPSGMEQQNCSNASSPANKQPPRMSISRAVSQGGSAKARDCARQRAALQRPAVLSPETRRIRGAAM